MPCDNTMKEDAPAWFILKQYDLIIIRLILYYGWVAVISYKSAVHNI